MIAGFYQICKLLLPKLSDGFRAQGKERKIMAESVLIKNAAVLACANIITRLAGLIYKVWLAGNISGEALGIYQLGMTVYMLFMSLPSSGLPGAVSGSCAAYGAIARGGAENVLRTGRRLGMIVSGIAALLLAMLAPFLAWFMLKDILLFGIFLVLLPAVFFGGTASVNDGYLHAVKQTRAVAFCEIAEQIVKIAIAVICIRFICGSAELQATGAVAGISAGGIAAFLASSLAIKRYCGRKNKVCPQNAAVCKTRQRKGGKDVGAATFEEQKAQGIPRVTAAALIKSALPVSANRFITSFISMATASIVPISLARFGLDTTQALSSYGIINGMVMPFIMLPCTVIGALCATLLPRFSELYAEKKKQALKKRILLAIAAAGGIGLLSGILIALFAPLIGRIVYKNSEAAQMLLMLSPCCIFAGLSQICTSVLIALKKERELFRRHIISVLVALVMCFFLPRFFGVAGYAAAILIQFAVECTLQLTAVYALKKEENHEKGIVKIKKKSYNRCIEYAE